MKILGILWTESLYSKKAGSSSSVFSCTILYFQIFDNVSRRDYGSIESCVMQDKVEGLRDRSPMIWNDEVKSTVGDPLRECTRK